MTFLADAENDTADFVKEVQKPIGFDPFSLDGISDEVTVRPSRFVFHGVHGIGKSSLAKHFPNPVFAFTEDGKGKLKVKSFGNGAIITQWSQFARTVDAMLSGSHSYETYVLDTLDWFEPVVWAETCSREKLADIEAPGYGKGYVLADKIWREFLSGMDALRDSGMNVVLLAHSDVTSFNPPDSDKYDRYDLAMHKRAREIIHEWADVVGFCHEKVITNQVVEGSGKSQKITYKGGASRGRVLSLERRSTWEAKNRFDLDAEVPLSNGPETAEYLVSAIAASFNQ